MAPSAVKSRSSLLIEIHSFIQFRKIYIKVFLPKARNSSMIKKIKKNKFIIFIFLFINTFALADSFDDFNVDYKHKFYMPDFETGSYNQNVDDDEWVFDFNPKDASAKICQFATPANQQLSDGYESISRYLWTGVNIKNRLSSFAFPKPDALNTATTLQEKFQFFSHHALDEGTKIKQNSFNDNKQRFTFQYKKVRCGNVDKFFYELKFTKSVNAVFNGERFIRHRVLQKKLWC